MMEYKGYIGKVDFDDEAGILHGEVIGLHDAITFQGASVEEVRQAFQDSVDDYLDFCQSRGEPAEKPFSGKLMVEIDPNLHRQITVLAQKAGKSLNAWVVEQLAGADANARRWESLQRHIPGTASADPMADTTREPWRHVVVPNEEKESKGG